MAIVAADRCFSPVEAYWTINPTYPFSCMDENLLLTAESSINTFTDFLVVLFPIPIVYELQMHRQQRMAIMGLFLLALSVCVVGIVRTVMIRQVMGRSLDLTWYVHPNIEFQHVKLELTVLLGMPGLYGS